MLWIQILAITCHIAFVLNATEICVLWYKIFLHSRIKDCLRVNVLTEKGNTPNARNPDMFPASSNSQFRQICHTIRMQIISVVERADKDDLPVKFTLYSLWKDPTNT